MIDDDEKNEKAQNKNTRFDEKMFIGDHVTMCVTGCPLPSPGTSLPGLVHTFMNEKRRSE